jgi:hypothetical protein
MPSDLIRGWGAGSRRENAVKKGFLRLARERFSCQDGRCPVSGASVFSPVAERAAWSAAIAQLVEHVIRNDGVTGSNPVCGTNKIKHQRYSITQDEILPLVMKEAEALGDNYRIGPSSR